MSGDALRPFLFVSANAILSLLSSSRDSYRKRYFALDRVLYPIACSLIREFWDVPSNFSLSRQAKSLTLASEFIISGVEAEATFAKILLGGGTP
jgi:hypothetical protein